MIKAAIFVEGLTERIFVKQLLFKKFKGIKSVVVKEMSMRGKDSFFNPVDIGNNPGIDIMFYIVEVPGYTKVVSAVVESAERMIKYDGFAHIIGLRDLIPAKRIDEDDIVQYIKGLLDRSVVGNKLKILLAIMETEAWFLYDWSAFLKIDKNLSPKDIMSKLGIDIVNCDPELEYNKPSKTIDNILKLSGLRYRKHEEEIERVVRNLDFNHLLKCNDKIKSFVKFRNAIDSAIVN